MVQGKLLTEAPLSDATFRELLLLLVEGAIVEFTLKLFM